MLLPFHQQKVFIKISAFQGEKTLSVRLSHNIRFAFQLFHECLAPNTMCDGTGCDNMTCIIVKPLHDGASDDPASNIADNESQDVRSTEPAQNTAGKNHQADKPVPETTSEPTGMDVAAEEGAGVACSRNLKRPNDSSDDVGQVANKRSKTDDVSVDDSSCVDTTSV